MIESWCHHGFYPRLMPMALAFATPSYKYHHSLPPALRFDCSLPRIRLPARLPMPFTIRPYRRIPGQCSAPYNADPFQGQGTIWNLSWAGWQLSGGLPMHPGETLSLTVTLPNEQSIEIAETVVRWSRGGEPCHRTPHPRPPPVRRQATGP